MNSLLDPAAGNLLYLARLTGVEFVAAITRRRRGGSISAADASLVLGQFRHQLVSEYLVVEMTKALIARAMALAETHALRGSDAVQLAAGLAVRARCLTYGLPLTVVSADLALNAAATAEALAVEDPNAHP